jgi:hypothetical protein
MTLKDNEKQWLNEFSEFIECDTENVPANISKNILNLVYQQMNPSWWVVFGKLLVIQSIAGLLSLLVCNQFGINPFKTGFSLSDYFMKFGHSTCMLLCGFIFLGFGVSASRLFLNNEEFLVIKKNSFLQVFSLSLIFLGVFAAIGAELTFIISLFWILGAMLGGVFFVFIPWHPLHR